MKSRSDSFRHHVLTAVPINAEAPSREPQRQHRHRRGGPERERASMAINMLWPGGIPDGCGYIVML